MKTLARTNRFKRDYKKAKGRRRDIPKLLEVVSRLASGEKLEPRYRDHTLGGEYFDCRECHIEPDWILIYRLTEDELVLIRTGSHSDLFE
ncbi:MAG: type II toxin-antitoxin system YafQ family toxin [Ignavibacteriales bacterium]|nr:type II toxin-antitoxin system YafQ family toxin [Ignavibacteriales bacterium]